MEDDYPELSFLSPNERDRYIADQLRKAQIARVAAARKQFSNFQVKKRQQYHAEKVKHDEKKKARIDPAYRKQKLQEKEQLKTRIEAHEQQFGSAQKNAQEALKQKKISDEEMEKVNHERELREKERFAKAMKRVYDEDPRREFEKISERLNSARGTARLRENQSLQRYNQKIDKIKEEAEKAAQDAIEEDKLLHPKLSIDDYARSFYHSGIGTIPVNHEAEEYAQQLEDEKSKIKIEEKKRKGEISKRSKMAARFSGVQKDTNELADELERIRAYETNEKLQDILETRAEMPIDKLYNQDDHYQKRQARIDRFLIVNDEAPIPRGKPPQPQPMILSTHTSPISSDNEDSSKNQ